MQETVRAASIKDKPQILEISKTIWEGRDYILKTIDDWLDPKTGRVIIIEKDGEIRAFTKITYINEDVGWLEGLRVKEKYRGNGYASWLTELCVEQGKELGLSVLRFACHRKTKGSIRSGLKHGFTKKGEFYSPSFSFSISRSLNPSFLLTLILYLK